jgi:hypothetical protein
MDTTLRERLQIATVRGANRMQTDTAAAQEAAIAFLSLRGTVVLEPVAVRSNFNTVFCCQCDNERLLLKVAQLMPRRLARALPRERIYTEARLMQLFRQWSDGLIHVPQVLYVDYENYCFLMTDVGADRRNLATVLANQYPLYAKAIPAMAHAIGRVHRLSRDWPALCPPEQSRKLRELTYRNLIGGGIAALMGDAAQAVLAGMAATRECLIHSNLWEKNMLLGSEGSMALVDYEGVIEGDPCVDLATLVAVGLLPVFQYGVSPEDWRTTSAELLTHYGAGLRNEEWFRQINGRLVPYLAVLLADRVAGRFPYSMDDTASVQLGELCRILIERNVTDWAALVDLVAGLAAFPR